MNKYDFSERMAKMMRDSRYQAGRSQDYLAKSLGVSKKTIQNWEAGVATPNLRNAIEWFDACGVPMYPYIMGLLYPQEIDGLTKDSDMHELRMALHTYVDELDDLHVRELLFLLYGSHGSSPTGTLDVVTAYLHLPMAMRVTVTENVMNNYEMAEALGMLRDDAHVMPVKQTLERYTKTAREAVYSGKESYTITRRCED